MSERKFIITRTQVDIPDIIESVLDEEQTKLTYPQFYERYIKFSDFLELSIKYNTASLVIRTAYEGSAYNGRS